MQSSDLAEINAFIQSIYRLQDTASLRALICKDLTNVIAGHNVFLGAHDMERTLITGCTCTHAFSTHEFNDIVNQSLGQHPLWEPIREGARRCGAYRASPVPAHGKTPCFTARHSDSKA